MVQNLGLPLSTAHRNLRSLVTNLLSSGHLVVTPGSPAEKHSKADLAHQGCCGQLVMSALGTGGRAESTLSAKPVHRAVFLNRQSCIEDLKA